MKHNSRRVRRRENFSSFSLVSRLKSLFLVGEKWQPRIKTGRRRADRRKNERERRRAKRREKGDGVTSGGERRRFLWFSDGPQLFPSRRSLHAGFRAGGWLRRKMPVPSVSLLFSLPFSRACDSVREERAKRFAAETGEKIRRRASGLISIPTIVTRTGFSARNTCFVSFVSDNESRCSRDSPTGNWLDIS